MTSSSGILSETSNATSRALSGGTTVDLMSAFRTLERRTGTYFETTPMDALRREALIEELVGWSTGDRVEGYDWSLVESANLTAPDDFQP